MQRIAFDLAARRSLPDAVGHLDAFVRSGTLTAADFRDWCDTVRLNDVVAVRAAAALVDPRSESVPESRLRVVLHLAGIDLEPQHVVRDGGRAVARVDLADVERRVAVEYDGVWHVLKEQLDRDRRRLNALRALGWSVVHVTAEMMGTPDEVVHTVRRALQSADRRDLA
ncbi:endonuclease domain-containing protein [Thalassiella azotivora]